jgi:hypothetical protein
MVEIQSQGQINERIEFTKMQDGRVWYTFPTIEKWTQSADLIPQIEVYPNGEIDYPVPACKEAITSEDMWVVMSHWRSIRSN